MCSKQKTKGFLYRIEHRSAEGLGVLLFYSLGHYCPEDGRWHRSRGALLLLLASWVIVWWWPTPTAPVVLNEKGSLHHDRCLKGTCTQSVGWLPSPAPTLCSVHTARDRQVKVTPQSPRPSSTPNHPPPEETTGVSSVGPQPPVLSHLSKSSHIITFLKRSLPALLSRLRTRHCLLLPFTSSTWMFFKFSDPEPEGGARSHWNLAGACSAQPTPSSDSHHSLGRENWPWVLFACHYPLRLSKIYWSICLL